MRGFKYFFFFTAVQDLIYTICFLVQVPKVITREFTFIMISTGPLRASPGGMIFMALFCLTTISSLVFVANSFLYRYIQLCRYQYLYLYSTKRVVLLGIFINLLIIANWMLMIRLCFWPNDAFLRVAGMLWATEELEVVNNSYIGMTSYDGANPLLMTLLIESLILLSTLATINPCCAMRIHRNLKENSLSDHTKKLHRQMLKLLLIQTACPAVFMHAPLGLMYILLLSGVTSPPALTRSGYRGEANILMGIYPQKRWIRLAEEVGKEIKPAKDIELFS
ncbi:7TM chemoreceptor [Ancylostoma ceylanicum]|uniref:7TM chemoreceptor n=1 Tax=Ancylostoma ceylanicum TaxID=53326 RepID=A0A0D6M555_9BILA|nr:7TM chemoreceptor [Ancylostoma ceylanicum]